MTLKKTLYMIGFWLLGVKKTFSHYLLPHSDKTLLPSSTVPYTPAFVPFAPAPNE